MQETADNLIIFLIITTALILLMAGFVVLIIFFYNRKQISYRKAIEEMQLTYENNLLSTQIEIQEQIFQTVSREIHDNISLSLTLAKLQLHTINFSNPAHIHESVNSVTGHISKAILDLSDISRNMNADIVIQRGLLAAVETETGKLRNTGLYQVEFSVTGEPVFMDGQKELVIFRIIQESLNNIIKHAKAHTIKLEMDYNETLLSVVISDDGAGFDMNESGKRESAGLTNMQKRATLIDGQCRISSSPEKGTVIQLSIPL
jgi:two-component system NarL family sensor kinase